MSTPESPLLDVVLQEACEALLPLQRVRSAEELVWLVARLGIEVPAASLDVGCLTDAKTAIADLVTLLDGEWTAAKAVSAIPAVRAAITALVNVSSEVEKALSTSGAELASVASDIPIRLFDYLLVDRLERAEPGVSAFLRLLRVIEDVESGSGLYRKIYWNRLVTALTAPQDVPDLYQWSTAFDADTFLERLGAFLAALGLGGGTYLQRSEISSKLGGPAADGASRRELRFPLWSTGDWPFTYAQLGLNVCAVESPGDPGARGLGAYLYTTGGVTLSNIPIGDHLQASVTATGLDAGIGLSLFPGGELAVQHEFLSTQTQSQSPQSPAQPLTLGVHVESTSASGAPLAVLLGTEGGACLSLGALSLGADLTKTAGDPAHFSATLGLRKLGLSLAGGEGDGLLARLLPAEPITLSLDLSYSPDTGLSFGVEGGLSHVIPVNAALGPVYVDSVTVALDVEGGRRIGLGVGVTGSASIGPVTFAVGDVGLTAALDFAPSNKGGLGGADLDFGFRWPSSLGIGVDSELVRGAGYLQHEPGRFSGAFGLTVQDRVGVDVVGIAVTRAPDGSPAFSFKMLGIVDFSAAPIPLGVGFSVFGLGLALAIECTMDDEALRRATYDGSLRSLLFPPDLARNAAQVLSDLDAFFPPKKGAFVVGAMAKLGWGGGVPLVQADVGVFVAWDEGLRVALAGTVSADLPDSVVPILRLRAQALGILDFAARSLSIDASLAGSSILDWALDGGLALRAEWGDAPRFALSAGGFFPGYAAPPGFPALRRVSLAIGTDNPRVSLEGYFAVTESSVQLGARVDLFYRKSVFILGDVTVSGRAGFDALLQLAPLHFEVGMYAGCEVTAGDFTLFGVDVAMTLAGPNPYHVTGTATVEILGIDLSVDFDETFGATRPEVASTLRVAELVAADLKEPRNWQVLQGGAAAPVRVREGAAGADPRGRLRFSQRRVPFGVTITWAGGARVSGDGYFDVTFAGSATPVLGAFAPGQYLDLTNEQKISAVPFESFKCGLDLGEGADLRPDPVEASMDYETLLPGSTTPVASPVSAGLEEAQSALDRRRRLPAAERYEMSADFGVVEISPPRFVVAGAPGGPTPGATWAEAFVRARDLRRSSARAAAGEGRVRRARARAER